MATSVDYLCAARFGIRPWDDAARSCASIATAFFLMLSGVAVGADPAWMADVGRALGKTGKPMAGDVYRVGLPRTDLRVSLDGVELKPAFALGSWLAFTRHRNDGMVMGDLVLTDQEVNPVMKKLEQGGIEVTALHNHLLRNQPFTMYMHISGHGDPVKLAQTLRDALSESKTPMGDSAPSPDSAAPSTTGLDTAAIDRALGSHGTQNGGVYQVSISRAEVIKDGGMIVPDAMGAAIAINFQPTGAGTAAITGDFVLVAKEVNPVLKSLRESGIEVTALHNHMLNDQPRLFFMHFWANDSVERLTSGLKAALAHVNTKAKAG